MGTSRPWAVMPLAVILAVRIARIFSTPPRAATFFATSSSAVGAFWARAMHNDEPITHKQNLRSMVRFSHTVRGVAHQPAREHNNQTLSEREPNVLPQINSADGSAACRGPDAA